MRAGVRVRVSTYGAARLVVIIVGEHRDAVGMLKAPRGDRVRGHLQRPVVPLARERRREEPREPRVAHARRGEGVRAHLIRVTARVGLGLGIG